MMTSYALLEGEPEPERGRDPRGDLRQPLPVHRLRQHRQGRAARGGRHGRGSAGQVGRAMEPQARAPKSEAWAIRSSARKTRASCAARATTSTTSSCPGMLYSTSSAVPTRTRRSRRSTPRKRCKVPGVLAVITGEGPRPSTSSTGCRRSCRTRRWCCPIDTVMYQAQEVAAVLATEPLRRRRRRGRGRGRVRAAAGRRRPVQGAGAGRAECCATTSRQEDNHIWHWEVGRPGEDRPGLQQKPTSWSSRDIYIPRIHVASIETCGCVAELRHGRQASSPST